MKTFHIALYLITLLIFLLILGYDGNSNSKSLLDAALYGDYLDAEYLIKQKGANVNFQSKHSGNTPLILASYAGHFDVVKLLVSNGAQINTRRYIGDTALIVASKSGNDKIVEFLINKGANTDFVGSNATMDGTALCWACYNGHSAVVKTLLKAKAKNYIARIGDPLTLAIAKGHINVVDVLLNNGYDPNIAVYGETPLALAVAKNNVEMVKLLLNNKTSVNELTMGKQTALDMAISKKNDDIIYLLRKHGAKTAKELHDISFKK